VGKGGAGDGVYSPWPMHTCFKNEGCSIDFNSEEEGKILKARRHHNFEYERYMEEGIVLPSFRSRKRLGQYLGEKGKLLGF